VAVVGGAALLLALTLPAASASGPEGPFARTPVPDAGTAEVYPVPAGGVFHIDGHGYGHGRGMSQWGAAGAAEHGLSAAAILSFYYPGTAQPTRGPSSIRVLISAATATTTQVDPAAGLTARDLDSNALYHLPTGPQRWRARRDGSVLRLESLNGSTWTAYPSANSGFVGPLRFAATGPVTLHVGAGSKRYRGTLTASPTGATQLQVVNTLDLESYVDGVVPAESIPSWPAAALQAQAVAARTYAIAHGKTSTYDICDTTACQVYGGVDIEDARTTAATQATAGAIRTYNGAPINAEFGASNGGWTVSGGVPYLPAEADPYDGIDPRSSNTWAATLSATDIQGWYPAVGTLHGVRVISRDGHGQWGGRITGLELDGVDRSGRATAVQLTDQSSIRLGLRSTWWRPENVASTLSGPKYAALHSTVRVTGTAPPGATVVPYFHKRDGTGYVARRALPVSADGTFATTYLADDDYRYYAVVSVPGAGPVSTETVLTQISPTITGPASAAAGSTVSITGTARPDSIAQIWFRRAGQSSFVMRRSLPTGAAGTYATTYLAGDTYSYYAVVNGLRSATVTTTMHP
jgi:SpoIID/LytB domain protein